MQMKRFEDKVINNRAGRALRPAVVVRKMGGCNRTARGARTHAVLSNLLVTAKQQGRDRLDYLSEVLTVRGKLPPLVPQRSPPAVNRQTLNMYKMSKDRSWHTRQSSVE